MPVKVPANLPAVVELRTENIFVIDEHRASSQDIRPLKIAILNLMPLKLMAETDLLRLISNTPLQIELDLFLPEGHEWKNTPKEHLDEFYKSFHEIKQNNYDGLIITGAPVEMVGFEEVDYWNQLQDIFEWSKTHVTSTIYICWAALAGLYHNYGIPKHILKKKISGVFPHYVTDKNNPLLRGFDDKFYNFGNIGYFIAGCRSGSEFWGSDIYGIRAVLRTRNIHNRTFRILTLYIGL